MGIQSTVTVRMKPEVRELFDTLLESLGAKSLRSLQEEMITGYLAAASYALRAKALEVEKEIAALTSREGDAETIARFVEMARYDARTVEELHQVIGDLIVKADSILDVPDLDAPQDIRRFIDSMMHTFRYAHDARYKRAMDINGLGLKQNEED